MSTHDIARSMKMAAPEMAASPAQMRNAALELVKISLENAADEIFDANEKDMEAAKSSGLSAQVCKRLKFDEDKLRGCLEGIDQLISLPDPVGRVQMNRELGKGLVLKRVSCPIGVIGVIFEARPDALVQISTLCLKSGNCAVLKGGKETTLTNRRLFMAIEKASIDAGLPKGCLAKVEAHAQVDELLECNDEIDLLIPRGSNSFVRHIMDNTKIPVLGHSDGICHTYVDKSADQEMALRVIVDAKCQYAAACNATETILVHEAIAAEFLPKLAKTLKDSGVSLRASKDAASLLGTCEVMDDDEFATEYLDLTASVKTVKTLQKAIDHINRFGSHHTDCIITDDKDAAEFFMDRVDSAGVYLNCSTRFADGFRYGFGAEVGISTGKIHARGPVGLEGLVTYKYRLYGSGQTVADFSSGKCAFTHKDL